jgi:hypothetical protein
MIRKTLSLAIALSLLLGVGASAYADTPTVGILAINQNGASGSVGLVGPGSTGTIGGDAYTETTATPGIYTITVTVPTGFVLNSVKDGSNNVLTAPYTQTLVAGSTITFNVNYIAAPVPAQVGTLVVNQAGALGTVVVAGPITASVTTATYSNASAAVGSYTLTVTAPTGFVVDKVKDGAGAVLTAPYTLPLAVGGTVTFAVSYVSAPTTPTTPAEITKEAISVKTKLCAAMEGGKAKMTCMKERNKMKRDFMKQEKTKKLKAKEEARKAKEEAKKLNAEEKAKGKKVESSDDDNRVNGRKK